MSSPRRFNDRFQDRVSIPLDVASAAATTTVKFHKCARAFVLESVDYINPTGLAGSDSNYFDIEVKDGATSMAKYSTKITGGQGTIAANTFTTVALNAAAANANAAAADILSLVLTLTGAATLPAGRIVLHGRYL